MLYSGFLCINRSLSRAVFSLHVPRGELAWVLRTGT